MKFAVTKILRMHSENFAYRNWESISIRRKGKPFYL